MGGVFAGGELFSLLAGTEDIGGWSALHDATEGIIGLWELWISRFKKKIWEVGAFRPPVGCSW
tara:strand:+ start:338 stop:526 length:189 start_codon:yes stop_codon:yes gene_type:complete